MDGTDRFALLVPWYLNGSLAADERRDLEQHLESCDGCRTLVQQGREMLEVSGAVPLAAGDEHVHPQLLVDYADRRDELDAATREWIEQRLARCADCRDALARLEQVAASLATAVQSPAEPELSSLARWWQRMEATLLRPAPALAYLLLLVAALPLLVWLLRPGVWDLGPPATSPAIVVVTGQHQIRAPGRPATAPLVVPADEDTILLELRTDLEPRDLQAPGTTFVLELAREGRIVWRQPRQESDFFLRQGRAVLTVLLHPSRMPPGETHEISIRVSRPGDPLDGQALFQRGIVAQR